MDVHGPLQSRGGWCAGWKLLKGILVRAGVDRNEKFGSGKKCRDIDPELGEGRTVDTLPMADRAMVVRRLFDDRRKHVLGLIVPLSSRRHARVAVLLPVDGCRHRRQQQKQRDQAGRPAERRRRHQQGSD